jgi:cyclophilin family peptidyl-prolyl cis-trans isomerase
MYPAGLSSLVGSGCGSALASARLPPKLSPIREHHRVAGLETHRASQTRKIHSPDADEGGLRMRMFLAALLALAVAGVAMADEQTATEETATEKKAMESTTEQKEEAMVKDTAIEQIDAQIAEADVDKGKKAWRTALPEPTPVEFDPEHEYFAHIQTNKGPIVIKFLPAVAPMHVTSFIYLTRLGYYDGLAFHRVIPQFMAQGGCPLGTGTGGPGYKYAGEFDRKVRHDRPGLLSMANAGPGTDGSQFFITFVPTPHLDGKHTIFGEVVEGEETLKAIEAVGSRPAGRTSEPIVMEEVTIEVE